MPRSTPVVSFGDAASARVATLGINPSALEFVDGDRLLAGAERRLATLDSLGATGLQDLNDAQVATVALECSRYFARQPYRRWFDPLDRLLRAGVDASYYDGSACHLDLIQWATRPVWGRIPDSAVRRALLVDGAPHLRRQLEHESIDLVLMNGRTVIEQVRATGLAEVAEVGQLPLGSSRCRLYLGTGVGVRWGGWSANLQSSFGVSNDFKRRLGEWLWSHVGASFGPASP